MMPWIYAIGAALALVATGAIYIRWRWRRAPQAYRAMIVVAAGFFTAGALAGAWLMHEKSACAGVSTPSAVQTGPSAFASPAPLAPLINPDAGTYPPTVQTAIPKLHYDPSKAILPDPKLTPGDTLPGVTADDICSYGWAKEHRHVTNDDRWRVENEYPNFRRTCACNWSREPDCCEIDHLIPLELGGSNEVRNLWPQPIDPRPGSLEKDDLENDLHARVCKGEMPLAEAQKCIASNWIECWKTYVVPFYGPKWAADNRRGW